MPIENDNFDFIVVGSGAGGGVLASRLARNNRGLRVLLIEAGSDPRNNLYYQVPAFHPLATEDSTLRWDYFVRHFTDAQLGEEDSKYKRYEPNRGIFYPRASAIGGCTAHHAMITVYPDPSDWDGIEKTTGDPSWNHQAMWRYFDRLRDGNSGFGWLPIEAAGIDTVLRAAQDAAVDQILLAAAKRSPHPARQLWHAGFGNIVDLFESAKEPLFDPNHRHCVEGDREGLYRIPLSIKDGQRRGVTEFIYATKSDPEYGPNLTIWENTLVTRVVIENGRAAGVEYFRKERAYRADRDGRGDDRDWSEVQRELGSVRARKEVILAGGAFNTPQLLMNSGIGPHAHLAEKGIPVIADRPGVGANLQDRYEIPVIDERNDEFALLANYRFTGEPDDPGFNDEWNQADRRGLYTTNGGTIAIMRRSPKAQEQDCDLLIFGIPGEFAGYKLKYSERIRTPEGRRRFSWIILKAHTDNNGEVRLRTTDPRDPPDINFKSFGDGKRENDRDLDALEWAVNEVRDFMEPLRKRKIRTGPERTLRRGAIGAIIRSLQPRLTEGEWLPGVEGPALRRFIATHAWGHHASCTAAIGNRQDGNAVLDGDFRVIGIPEGNLRVVDASVFPRIPGYFIVLPIYMVAEKAADVILNEYRAATQPIAEKKA